MDLGPDNKHVQKFHAFLDKHVQMAGLLLKTQLLSGMFKKRMKKIKDPSLLMASPMA